MSSGDTDPKLDKEKMLQDLIDEQAKFDAEFRDHQSQMLAQTRKMQNQIFNQLGNRKPVSPEIQELVTILMEYPLLVPSVRKYIDAKVAKIQEAVQGIVNE